MSEENSVNVDVTDVSDEQVSAFFENGGELPEQKQEVEKPVDTEPRQEAAKEEAREEPKEKYVPLAALHEEREKRKELKGKVEKMEQLFQQLQTQLKPGQEKPEVTYEDDPFEYLKRQTDEVKTAHEEQKRQAAEYNDFQSTVGTYQAKAAEFSQATPDFKDAYQHLVASRINEYQAMGYDERVAQKMAQNDELAIVKKALEDEVNPAERMYQLAKVRGYSRKEVAQEVPKQQPKLDTIEKGLKASQSLSSMGGASPKSLSLEDLADMDCNSDEFKRGWDQLVSRAR